MGAFSKSFSKGVFSNNKIIIPVVGSVLTEEDSNLYITEEDSDNVITEEDELI